MNNGFGPLFTRRQNRAKYCAIAIVAISLSTLFGLVVYLQGKSQIGVVMYLLSMSVLAMFLGEVLRRCCLLAEEFYHARERYNGSKKKIFYKVFSIKNSNGGDIAVILMFVVFVLLALYSYSENKAAISHEGGRYFLLLFQNIAIVPIIGYIAGIKGPADVERSELNERYNTNLADGLAWSYYFGYLKFILPELEKAVTRNATIRNNLQPVKLFILIPRTCYCPGTIQNEGIEVHTNLQTHARNRGGIQDRKYHNTVYKITISNTQSPQDRMYEGEYYCLLEYASPLITLYKMSNSSQELSEEERVTQVKLFVNKLTEILDKDEKCKGKYQLIPLANDKQNDLAITIVKAMKSTAVVVPSPGD